MSTLELKIYRFGVLEKTHGGYEFYSLEALSTRVRSSGVALDVQCLSVYLRDVTVWRFPLVD